MVIQKQFSSFKTLLATSKLPVLVDFYATWCGPCQMMGPILEQVGANLSGRIQIIKIDSDKYPGISSQYGVQALPTLVLFKKGKPVERIEGVVQASQLIQHLQILI